MAETADVVVIGAGAVGSAIAYYLADAGADVVLVEREAIASGASTHATGSFSLLATDFDRPDHLQLGVASYKLARDLLPRLKELTNVDMLYQYRPAVRLALEESEVRLIQEQLEWQTPLVPAKWITGEEVRAIEPRLSPNILGGAYQDESLQLDSGRFTLALATGAERRGARIVLRKVTGLERSNGKVTGVRHTTGTIAAPNVVLAMGPWAALASPWLGFDVPVRPLWGERLLLQYDGPPLPMLVASPRRGHMISRLDGFLSVGSTAGRDLDDQNVYVRDLPENEIFDTRPTEAALMELLQRAIDVFPAVEEAGVAQQLAGVRPLSPDRAPIIGPVPGVAGAYLATGHGTKGIHLAPATGKIIADLVLRGSTDVDAPLEPISPARFTGREPSGATAPLEEVPAAMRVQDD
ncbi:MAG: FAD-binding oxidoreductase [Chloroflexi bacterium]|nr:FAD-binding oxidoreductase [Chloroflexota bacterium]